MTSQDTPPRVHKLTMCETIITPAEDGTRSPESTQPQPNSDPTSDEESSQESQSSKCHTPNLNTTNLKTNEIYGDDLQLPKPSHISRFSIIEYKWIQASKQLPGRPWDSTSIESYQCRLLEFSRNKRELEIVVLSTMLWKIPESISPHTHLHELKYGAIQNPVPTRGDDERG